MLMQADGEPVCVCEFTEMLEVSQPTVSHHLKQLTDAGLLERERRGSFVYFSLRPRRARPLASLSPPQPRSRAADATRPLARRSSPSSSAPPRSSSPAAARSWSTPRTQALGHVGVAISFGLVIMVMIYAVGHVSGAHFNPALTFAFALTRHVPWPRVWLYWGAQAAGAIAAAIFLRASSGTSPMSAPPCPPARERSRSPGNCSSPSS